MMESKTINIYTDGSSRGNPGPGGYGIVMEHVGSGYSKEFSEGFTLTTNNRMELMGVIEALKKLRQKTRMLQYTQIQNMFLILLKKNGFLIGKKTILKRKKI